MDSKSATQEGSGKQTLFLLPMQSLLPMSLGRFLASLYAVVFLVLSAFSGISFMQTYQEFSTVRMQAAETRQRLQVAEQDLREQERMLAQLRSDPQYVESMIRRKLGYAKQGETVFRFRE